MADKDTDGAKYQETEPADGDRDSKSDRSAPFTGNGGTKLPAATAHRDAGGPLVNVV